MTQAIGYAVHDAVSAAVPFVFERRLPGAGDIQIKISYCGVCHSDLHQARNDWGDSVYPVVPGHEIVGIVTAIGEGVTRFKVGDRAAVGCMVDSCLACDQCDKGEEQLCRKRATMTYNGTDRQTGERTLGGYSDHIVVREEFVLKVPDTLDFARVAPLLCAGITTYSPLKAWNVQPGSRVGVVGLGGLGHMAVKLAVGLGADVTVITTSPGKEDDAMALGARTVLVSADKAAMKVARSSFDLIIDTVPVAHDLSPYLNLLDIDGTIVLLGAIEPLPGFHAAMLVGGRKRVTGSMIGGIAETQELLDFCAAQNILPETETIAMQDINGAWDRMAKSDVKYRFVIDMASLEKDGPATL